MRSLRRAVLALSIVVVPTLIHGTTASGAFVWLDHVEIVEGRLIVQSWRGLVRVLLTDDNFQGYYRPVNSLSHTIDYVIWGLQPLGHRWMSVLGHVVNGALLFRLIVVVGVHRHWAAAAVLAWSIHPLSASVAGLVGSRADILIMTFAMAYVVSASSICTGRRKQSLVPVLLLLLALGTKEVAVVAPIAVWMLSPLLAKQSPEGVRSVRAQLPLHGLVVVGYLSFRFLVGQVRIGAVSSIGLWDRLLTFAAVYVGYVRSALYPMNVRSSDTVRLLSAYGSGELVMLVLAIGILVVAAVTIARYSGSIARALAAGNLFLLPVAQIIPLLHFRSDRYLYMPLAMWAFAASLAIDRYSTDNPRSYTRLWGAISLVIVFFFAISAERRGALVTDDAFFEYEVSVEEQYREGLCMLGRLASQRGEYEAASDYFERCLKPADGLVSYVDTGTAIVDYAQNLVAQGRYGEARLVAAEAVSWLDGERLAVAMLVVGVASVQLGDIEEAREWLVRCLSYPEVAADAQYWLEEAGSDNRGRRLEESDEGR